MDWQEQAKRVAAAFDLADFNASRLYAEEDGTIGGFQVVGTYNGDKVEYCRFANAEFISIRPPRQTALSFDC